MLKEEEDVKDLMIGSTSVLKLIDYGQSIDMDMFPPDTTFMASVATPDFQCIEMQMNRPWTYQASASNNYITQEFHLNISAKNVDI